MEISGTESPLAVANKLKAEAHDLIYQDGLDAILQHCHPVRYTGSFFLDVMAWRDLDIELSLVPDPFSLKAFFELGEQIASTLLVVSMTFYNRLEFPLRTTTPPGLYWNILVQHPVSREQWNIDLWSFAPEVVERNWGGMCAIAERIDATSRQAILQLKQELLTTDGQTPQFSGYHIYQAIVYEKLTDRQAIMKYLHQHGVAIAEQ